MASQGWGRKGRPRGASQAPPIFDQQAFAEAVGIVAAAIAQASAVGSQGGPSNLKRFRAHHPPIFTGGGDPMVVDHWFRLIEKVLEAIDITSDAAMSRPGSRSDSNGESEPSPGRETVLYNETLIDLFFIRANNCTCVFIHMHNFCNNKNHLHIQKNYHRSGVHQNLYTYTESHLLIHVHLLLNIFCSSGIQNIIILLHWSLLLIQTLIHIPI